MEVNAQYGQPDNQVIETERTVNAEMVTLNPIDAENNSSTINPEIPGIDLISVPIEYVTEEGPTVEAKTSTTHASFNGARETTEASDNACDSSKIGKGKKTARKPQTVLVLDSLSTLKIASKKQGHSDKADGVSEMKENDRKRIRILAGNTKSSFTTVEAAIQPRRS